MSLPTRSFGPVTRTDIVRYQGASGDFNPIHHDEPFAHAAGLPAVLSVGMLQAGYLATYCAEQFGPENVRAFKVRFLERVWPGDVLTCTGEIVAEEPSLITVELRMERAPGEAVLTGSATFAV